MRQTLRIDMAACAGHGVCAELLPEWIELDDWGYPMIDAKPLPPGLVAHAKRAVAACPVLALRLVADEPAAVRPPLGSPR
jgi:ferredoxin